MLRIDFPGTSDYTTNSTGDAVAQKTVAQKTLCETERAHSDEFETCPSWVPDVDKRRRRARITLKTMLVHGFDHRANWVAKVRYVSTMGSQIERAPTATKLFHRLPTGAILQPIQTSAEIAGFPRVPSARPAVLSSSWKVIT